MKKEELVVGKEYVAKHSSGICVVRLDAVIKSPGFRRPGYGQRASPAMTRYECTKVSTGRKVTFRSALKFLKEKVQLETQQ